MQQETYFEQKEREAKEQQASEKLARDYQAQQQEFAKQYAEKQDSAKAALTPEQVQQNVDSAPGEKFGCISQAHAKFQAATPDQRQEMTAAYIPQDNREAGSREATAQPRFNDHQLPVEHSKTTNVASHLAQRAYDKRMDYLEQDEQFAGQIEAENDPVKKQHLELQRAVATEKYEMATAHSASNVSRLVGDKENDVKFAAQATEHEVRLGSLEERLREFEQAHGLDVKQEQEHQQTNEKESAVAQPKELTAGQKKIVELQEQEGEKNHVPVTEEHKAMARAYEARSQEAQKELAHSRDREQEKER